MRRFWGKVIKTSTCWNWAAAKSTFGHGRFSHNGRNAHAHRVSWEAANGPIPDGLCVLHKCDNPACVRPTHLFLGTREDNIRDMIDKGRSVHPGKPRSYSDGMVYAVRCLLGMGFGQKDIKRRTGVSQTHVSRIKRGETYSDLVVAGG